MALIKISEAEWNVMEVLWREHPLTSSEIVARLKAEHEWAPNTVRTLLSRLAEKGHIQTENDAGRFLYMPLTSRDSCVEQEGKNFLSRIFGGSSAPLLLHFAKSADLTPEEAKELRKILEKKNPKK